MELISKDMERSSSEVNEFFQALWRDYERANSSYAVRRLISSMKYACSGGKRVRAFLIGEGLSFAILGREKTTKEKHAQLKAMVAMESIHAYSLVHDDLPCMDDDDMRRGKPTLHREYDEATAILCGDALLTLAFELLSGMEISEKSRLEIIAEFAKSAGIGGMVAGQAMDMRAKQEVDSEKKLLELHGKKTGALISCALVSGAMIGGGSYGMIEKIRKVGTVLGQLFQVIDDILDVEGDPKNTGKATGGDIDKVTLYSFVEADKARQYAKSIREKLNHNIEFLDRASQKRVSEFADLMLTRRG